MIASIVRESIAPVLIGAPRECGIVSITEVEVSPDASYATVYVSALKEPQRALAYLADQRGVLQKALGKKVTTHRTPMLRFRIDARVERGERIDHLLSLYPENPSPAPAEGTGSDDMS